MLCAVARVALSAHHIQGQLLVLADSLSRLGIPLPTEWPLLPRVLGPIWQQWGRPLIVLFATKFNAQLPVYIAILGSPGSGRRRSAVPMEGVVGLRFPPFALRPWVLHMLCLVP